MAKVTVYEVGEKKEKVVFGGKVKVSILAMIGDMIHEADLETNQPCISIYRKEDERLMHMELTWKEAIKLWESLTSIVSRDIMKNRIEDVLIGRKTCHYCGTLYEQKGREK